MHARMHARRACSTRTPQCMHARVRRGAVWASDPIENQTMPAWLAETWPCAVHAVLRQVALLRAGRGSEVVQETRLWDEGKQETTSMRKKEGLADYRWGPALRLLCVPPTACDGHGVCGRLGMGRCNSSAWLR